MTGSPFTRTTKFPRPGFSGLMTTVVSLPMADTIFFARVINADHCLQASIVTTAVVLLMGFVFVLVVAEAISDAFVVVTFFVTIFAGLVVAAAAAFFTLGLDTDVADADAGGGISFFAAAAAAMVRPPLVVDRVDRTIVVWNVENPVDIFNVTTAGTMYRRNRFMCFYSISILLQIVLPVSKMLLVGRVLGFRWLSTGAKIENTFYH